MDMAENCARLLRPLAVKPLLAAGGREGLELLQRERPDLVLTDLMMPDIDGMEVLAAVKEWDPEIVVIMLTGYGTINTAVQAIRAGAYDFITKPFSGEQLRVVVERAIDQRRLKEENARLKRELQSLHLNEIVGSSKALRQTFEIIKKVAPMDTNILIIGESGTGKELFARSVHVNSRRADKPFVPVDCAALSEELLESELFGHERGAFTGATGKKQGLLEVADGGTLFLDELGELSPRLQVKLLRVLQEKTFRRVGGTKEIQVDVRVVSATNRDLIKAIKASMFREELYFRLNGVTITLPPLRERHGDIPILAQHFLDKFNKTNGQEIRLGRDAIPYLESYPWPGNVRELKNVVERAAILAEGSTIHWQDLPTELLEKHDPGLVSDSLSVSGRTESFTEAKQRWIEIFEKRYLQDLLYRNHWNFSKAAEEAGINRKTIHRLVDKYNLRQS